MRPLVAVRRAIPFDRHFLTRSALFWPLARAAAAIEHYEDFPPLEALALVFEGEPRVRFVEAPPRRPPGAGVGGRALYEAPLALAGAGLRRRAPRAVRGGAPPPAPNCRGRGPIPLRRAHCPGRRGSDEGPLVS